MELSQIINQESKPIPTKPIKTIGEDYVWLSQKHNLNANELTIYEINKPFILDYGEFSCKSNLGFAGVYIYTTINGALTQISRCVDTDAGVSSPFKSAQFLNVYKFGSAMFEMYSYDADSQVAKMGLKNQMYFPNGIKISVGCSSGTSSVAAIVSGRVVK